MRGGTKENFSGIGKKSGLITNDATRGGAREPSSPLLKKPKQNRGQKNKAWGHEHMIRLSLIQMSYQKYIVYIKKN